MKLIFSIFLIIILCIGFAFAQKVKNWTEWSQKDVSKILNDSPWAQTQTFFGSELPQFRTITPMAVGRGNVLLKGNTPEPNGPASRTGLDYKGESGESKASTSVFFRVRFLTAKPVREAFARAVLLKQTNASKELEAQLQSFIDRDFDNFLVVALAVESPNEKIDAGVTIMLGQVTLESLKEHVYLERADGKRIMITDYKVPINDGMGAKLIFDRMVDGQPFLTQESDSVRFYMELNDKQKVDKRFKTSDMLYGGKLEY